MEVVDISIIAIAILGIVVGWQRGFIKETLDLLALFISMVLASLLKGPITNALYGLLPFFTYGGDVSKLHSVNLLLYQVIIYLLLILLFLGIYQLVIIKTKLKDKITDTIVETNSFFTFLGAIIGAPLMILFLYNVLLVIKLPVFNYNMVNDSLYTNIILEKMPIISKNNETLYLANEHYLKEINKKSDSVLDKESFDNRLANDMVKKKLIKKSKLKSLIEKGLIPDSKGPDEPLEEENGIPGEEENYNDSNEIEPEREENYNDSKEMVPEGEITGETIGKNIEEVTVC